MQGYPTVRRARCPAGASRALAVCALLLVAAPLQAQQAASLDSLLEAIRSRHDLPALAGAVVHRGEVIGIGATGVRAVGSPERVTTRDRWHIGSDTKAMTATLIARLIEDGILSWQTTIGDVFPELADSVPAAWLPVTVAQLVTHTSGLPGDGRPDPQLFARIRQLQGTLPEQRRQLVSLVLRSAPAATPGSVMAYSNFGYVIAGAMLERLTGAAWEDLLRDEVLTPLGMSSTGFGAPGAGDSAISQPRGHMRGNALPPGPLADNPAVLGPAGTVHTTLADWARFAAAHAAEGRGDPNGFLSAESWRMLHTPPAGRDYAGGWLVVERPWAGGRALTHSGSNTWWFAVAWIAPERDLAVLIASNTGGPAAPVATDQAAGALIQWFQARAAGPTAQ